MLVFIYGLSEPQKYGNTTSYYRHIENEDVLKKYMDSHFDLLTQLIMKKFNYEYTVAIYVTYKLLLIFTVKYYSNMWKSEYGYLFLSIDEIPSLKGIRKGIRKRPKL